MKLEELRKLKQEAERELIDLDSPKGLEDWRIDYLGRKGKLTQVLRGIGSLPDEEKSSIGKVSNEIKSELEKIYQKRRLELNKKGYADSVKEKVDITLPGYPIQQGKLHPSTRILRQIFSIFTLMGFQIFDGPEVETDLYNFELLNMPPHHPARDMWDTFYINNKMLLRTHTSPGQIHAMQHFCPEPIRVILPGKCYRYEAITARSEIMFHQVEGLAVGKHITMADLKGVLTEFAHQMYGDARKTRFRCSYFPFTEPSVEMDIDCLVCKGEGCQICKQSGWLEILGAGMVHPRVLENGGYDPRIYTGFAFGMGPERIAMLKYGIDDIRLFFSNDLRFLEQFD